MEPLGPRAGRDPAGTFSGRPDEVARRLLGMLLVRSDGRILRVVEVEAYGAGDDPASHAFGGRNRRNATMWGPPGLLYVHRSHGLHWCANVTCGSPGQPAAVLLRAGEPLAGLEAMRRDRWRQQRHRLDRDLARGPGRLGQAMGIDASLDGADLIAGDRGIALRGTPGSFGDDLPGGPRIGISRATELPWRFVVAGSPWLSAPQSAALLPERPAPSEVSAPGSSIPGPRCTPGPPNVASGTNRLTPAVD